VEHELKQALLTVQKKDHKQQNRRRDKYDKEYDQGKVKKLRSHAVQVNKETAARSRDQFDKASRFGNKRKAK